MGVGDPNSATLIQAGPLERVNTNGTNVYGWFYEILAAPCRASQAAVNLRCVGSERVAKPLGRAV
jgi:hypothetical protein